MRNIKNKSVNEILSLDYYSQSNGKAYHQLGFDNDRTRNGNSLNGSLSNQVKKVTCLCLLTMAAVGIANNSLAQEQNVNSSNTDDLFKNIDNVTIDGVTRDDETRDATTDNASMDGGTIDGGTSDGLTIDGLTIDNLTQGMDDAEKNANNNENKKVANESSKTIWGGERRFTFKHDFSYVTSDPSEVKTNRSSLRIEWDKGFGEHYHVHVDVKALGYFSNDRIARDEDQSFASDTKTKELYLQGSWGSTSITAGNKIVIWGESETAPVTDILSPQNQSELVFTSLDESRIAQTMVVLDQYTESGQWTFIINPDVKTNEDPPGEDINDAINVAPDAINVIGKEFETERPEYGFRWKRALGIGDFSIMLADISDNQSVYKFTPIENGQQNFYEYYGRYQMVGAAANLNYGDIAIQLESAFSKDRPQKLAFENPAIFSIDNPGFICADVLQTSFTGKYQENGLRDWTFGLSNSHIFSDVSLLESENKDLTEIIAAVANKFFHDTLVLKYTHMYQIKTGQTIQNLTADYAVTDNLKMSLDMFVLKDVGPEKFAQDSVVLRAIYAF